MQHDKLEPLFRMVYMSEIKYSSLFDYNFFSSLIKVAQKNNRRNDVNGILCFGNGYFFQYIEGNEQNLTNLKNRILEDNRHYKFKLIDFSQIENRKFSKTPLLFIFIDKVNTVSNNKFSEFLPFTPHQWDAEYSMKLIDLIEQQNISESNLHLKRSKIDTILLQIKLLWHLFQVNANKQHLLLFLGFILLISIMSVSMFTLIDSKPKYEHIKNLKNRHTILEQPR